MFRKVGGAVIIDSDECCNRSFPCQCGGGGPLLPAVISQNENDRASYLRILLVSIDHSQSAGELNLRQVGHGEFLAVAERYFLCVCAWFGKRELRGRCKFWLQKGRALKIAAIVARRSNSVRSQLRG